MSDYPFALDQIENDRFHGVISGRLRLNDGKLQLLTVFGRIALYPSKIQRGGFHAARTNLEHNPDQLLHVYGFPRTNRDGVIKSMQLISFHTDGSEPSEEKNLKPFSYRFAPGQFWLCGRVRELTDDGQVVVKVTRRKGRKEDGQQFWLVTGRAPKRPVKSSKTLFHGFHDECGALILMPEKLITPPKQQRIQKPPSLESVLLRGH